MPKRRRKHWSKMIEESGLAIRLFERAGSSAIWYSVVQGGKKRRRSLKTTDRALAEERARAIARELALLDLCGGAPGSLTIGKLAELYLHHRGPLLTQVRRRTMTMMADLFRRHLGDGFLVSDFGQHELDTYVAARTSSRLLPTDRRAAKHPADGTIRQELRALATLCNWAVAFRRGGRPLLAFNPVHGLKIPEEKNPIRPVASADRYKALLAQADRADPEGRLHVLLVLAWETGRRINAILHLRASDVLLSADQLRSVLAGEGQDEALAEHWPQAVRWRADFDKVGYLDVAPISGAARAALEAYLVKHPKIGEAWIFPANRDKAKTLDKLMAGYYLAKAERLAGLPKIKRGGWHTFRRGWAQRRKHLPVQDVMAAGGWRDVKALQTAYQAADPETVLRVVEGA